MEFRRHTLPNLLYIAMPVAAALAVFAAYVAADSAWRDGARRVELVEAATRSIAAALEAAPGSAQASDVLAQHADVLAALGASVRLIDERGVELARSPRRAGGSAAPAPDVSSSEFNGWAADAGGPPSRVVIGGATFTLHVIREARPGAFGGVGWRGLALVGAVLTVLATLALAVVLDQRFRQLVRRLTRDFRMLTGGDRLETDQLSGSVELRLLSRAMHDMRSRLIGNTRTIDHQRRTLASLLAQLREGVLVAGRERNVALINPAAIRLLNLGPDVRPESLVGIAIERCVPQLELQRLLEPSAGGVTNSTLDPRVMDRRLQVETVDGTLHLLAHASNILLPGENGRAEQDESVGRLLVLTDITALTRTIQMRTDFVANASHELRTPLSTIMAAVETLQRMDEHDAVASRKFIDVIDRQCRRLHDMATDLLELSRIEVDPARFKPRMNDVRDLLDELAGQFAARLESRGVRLEIDTSACADPQVYVNAQLLRLVLDNLVDNAVKFSDAGRTVFVRVRRSGDAVEIEVEDQGCGIPLEEQERVFERFYQVQRARSGQERGTGLGLSIVRHAINAMRARVTLNSKVGVGTRVVVAVPQASAATQALSNDMEE